MNCGIPVEQNNPGYLKEFLVHNFLFSRLISKYDNVFLQFTTARLITIYDNVLLQFLIAWLLQFSTTVITIYERYYDSRQNRVPYKASGLHTNFCLPGSVEISYVVALTFVFNSIDDRTSSIGDRFVRSSVSIWSVCTISCITYLPHYFSYHMLFPHYLLFCLNNFRKNV